MTKWKDHIVRNVIPDISDIKTKRIYKTIVNGHIDNLKEGVSISLATLQRLEKNIIDLGNDYTSAKDAMYSLHQQNLSEIQEVYVLLHNRKSILNTIPPDKIQFDKETFTEITSRLETITNNLLRTRTMLEGQPWI
jgi:hypothetical protein